MSCDVGEVTERLENDQSSFSNLSVTSPTSQLILQSFRRFTYVTAHSPTLPLLHLRHSSFSNPSFASPTPQALHLIHLASRPCFKSLFSLPRVEWKSVDAHSPNFQSLHLRHNSFSNHSVALPTSQLILQPLRCFTYVTVHSPILLSLLLRHRLFTYFIWRAAHALNPFFVAESRLEVGRCSFSNLSVTSPTSQLILQPFRRFTYVTDHSPTLARLHLRHSLFSNPSSASPTSQALHLRHLASPHMIYSTMNVVFLAIISLHISRRACNPSRDHPNSYHRTKIHNICMYLCHS